MRYVSVDTASQRLGIPRSTITHRIRVGIMRADRVGRAWLIPERELQKWETNPPEVKRGVKPRRHTRQRTPNTLH